MKNYRMNWLTCITCLFLALSTQAVAQNGNSEWPKADYQVVPLPSRITLLQKEDFVLNAQTLIVVGSDNVDMQRNGRFLQQYIEEETGLRLSLSAKVEKGRSIVLRLNQKMLEPEGYRMTVDKRGVTIEGMTPQGVFYGIQTLRKSLVFPDKGQETVAVVLPAAEITDAPRFSYRGMHLDVARHFFSLDFVKQYIDMMVLHNMNRYGGYYTQQEMKEIVQYAKERFITVIPEIDMPGHMLGALTAYPELGCTGGPYEVEGHWGVFDDILCAGKEETFRFVEGVLEEVMDIFPSEYIHIGGDEAPRTRWEKCPLCQERIRKEHLTAKGNQSAEARLQGYFTKRVEAFVQSKGRKLIGWDELLDSDVNPSATIMSWRGVDGGLVASEKGHDVIMSPTSHCYFNFYLVKDYEWGEPYAFAEVIPIEKTYSFDPAPASLSEQAKKHILGAQGNLWSEYIHYNSEAEYQVLPRMGALSEVQWMQPSQKDFKAWVERERRLTLIYNRKGWAFAKHAFRK